MRLLNVIRFRHLVLCITLIGGAPALAKETNVSFGTIAQDTTAPVEMTTDNLSVDQATGKAIFEGNVLIEQGNLRLSAGKVEVVYRAESAGIAKLIASGGVTLVAGADAAEATRAVYDIDSGAIVMSGDVLLAQGPSALTAQKMTINLKNGTANMSGQVKTILQTGKK